ncbi:MAG: phosphoribosyltransferase [Proteobacteria bacterium]|nr:phosphoribosyltransferase [Pseudomonadota bacterium]
MKNRIYADRRDAGRALAPEIQACELHDPIVLGLPRGGIPVAYEIALALDAPLDVLVVRKLGVPFQPELALGAIASGQVRVLNEQLLEQIPGLDEALIEEITARETKELTRREKLYRGERPYPELRDRDVVVVDDGMATGSTMRAAAEAVQSRDPAKVLIAVPTASADAVALVADIVDQVICLDTPSPFFAVGYFYRNFGQTTDDEVRRLLHDAWEGQQLSGRTTNA